MKVLEGLASQGKTRLLTTEAPTHKLNKVKLNQVVDEFKNVSNICN